MRTNRLEHSHNPNNSLKKKGTRQATSKQETQIVQQQQEISTNNTT